MFKYFYEPTENCQYYIGETVYIKALYKSIRRNKSTSLTPLFCGTPRFNMDRLIYALCIDENGYVTICNSDAMLAILMFSNSIKQEEKI